MKSKFWLNILTVVILALLAYFGYKYFFGGNSTDTSQSGIQFQSGDTTAPVTDGTDTAVASATSSDITNASQQFITLLNSISGIDFKRGTILQSRVFMSAMQDFSKPLPNKESGRLDPFAATDLNADSIIYSTTTWPVATPPTGKK
jgi:hypothetical protein